MVRMLNLWNGVLGIATRSRTFNGNHAFNGLRHTNTKPCVCYIIGVGMCLVGYSEKIPSEPSPTGSLGMLP